MLGPAAGGFLIVRLGFPFIYALDACCAVTFFLLVLPIKSGAQGGRVEGGAWEKLAAGIRFVLSKKVILATITLDLFAVLGERLWRGHDCLRPFPLVLARS